MRTSKLVCWAVASALLMISAAPPALARARTADEAKLVAKAREHAAKRHRVEVKLRDGTKLKGWIVEVDDRTFTLVDRETGARRAVAIGDVAKIGRKRNPFGFASKVGDGMLIALGVALVICGCVMIPHD
jgi:small nuclear ribonucleoprotein (snRNP)-like protein